MDWKEFFIGIIQTAGTKLLLAALILAVGFWLAKFLPKLISRAKGFKKSDASLQSFLLSCVRVLIYSMMIVSAAVLLGVPTTSFLTVLTSAGVAIGLALQGSLANFAGGIMILIFKPFKVGDYIKGSNAEGTVRNINIFYTTIITLDNKRISVPNGELSNSSIINCTVMGTRRHDIPFSVSYKTDPDTVRDVLLKVADGCEFVEKSPAPAVYMTNHGASSLDFILRVWSTAGNYWDTEYYLREEGKKMFDKHGIEIPFNQLDVHLDNNK